MSEKRSESYLWELIWRSLLDGNPIMPENAGKESTNYYLDKLAKTLATYGGVQGMANIADVPSSVHKPDLAGNSYAITTADYIVLIDDDDADVTGTVVVALPAVAISDDRVLHIKKIGNSQTVQLDGNGAETIDGDATKEMLTQYDCLSVACDKLAWYII